MLPLIRYELQPGMGVAVMKQNLCDAGIIASRAARHPTQSLDPTDVAELRALRAGMDLLAFRWAAARRVSAAGFAPRHLPGIVAGVAALAL